MQTVFSRTPSTASLLSHIVRSGITFRLLNPSCWPASLQLNWRSSRAPVLQHPFQISKSHSATTASMHTEALNTLITGRRDAYDGLIIDPATLPPAVDDFYDILCHCLKEWRALGVRGVWLKLPIANAHFVGPATDAGFVFHHAEPDYVMMTAWLPDTENKLPPSATHQVGVGAFVYDAPSQCVLVVQEKSGPLRGQGVWKIPTGLVQAGEDVTEAAVREVLEETGVKCRFKSVLALRQAHGLAFGKSDMFFVVALEPELSMDDAVLTPQEDEIEAVQWMKIADYAANPFTSSRPLLKTIVNQCVAWAEGRYQGLGGARMQSGFADSSDLLLFGEVGDETAQQHANEDTWVGIS